MVGAPQVMKDLCLGWYVEKMVLENLCDYDDLLERDDNQWLSSHVEFIKRVRLKHFSDEQCYELVNRMQNEEKWDKDIGRLCEAVFCESITGDEGIFGYVYEKLKKACAKMEAVQAADFVKYNCVSHEGRTMKQFATTNFLEMDETFQGKFFGEIGG